MSDLAPPEDFDTDLLRSDVIQPVHPRTFWVVCLGWLVAAALLIAASVHYGIAQFSALGMLCAAGATVLVLWGVARGLWCTLSAGYLCFGGFFITRKSGKFLRVELPLINSVAIRRPGLARVFGLAQVNVTTTAGQQLRVRYLHRVEATQLVQVMTAGRQKPAPATGQNLGVPPETTAPPVATEPPAATELGAATSAEPAASGAPAEVERVIDLREPPQPETTPEAPAPSGEPFPEPVSLAPSRSVPKLAGTATLADSDSKVAEPEPALAEPIVEVKPIAPEPLAPPAPVASERMVLERPQQQHTVGLLPPLKRLRALLETFPPGTGYERDPYCATLLVASHRIGMHIPTTTARDRFIELARRKFFDRHVLQALDHGRQHVITIGAGLDTIAFRLPLPSSVRLCEIDAPSVLEFKEQALAEAGAASSCSRAVLPTLAEADWSDGLAAVGITADQPATWVIHSVPPTTNIGGVDPTWYRLWQTASSQTCFLGQVEGDLELAEKSLADLAGTTGKVELISMAQIASRLGCTVPDDLAGGFLSLTKG